MDRALALLRLALVAAAVVVAPRAAAAPGFDPSAVPDELRDWVPWLRARHPELGCPVIGEARTCRWPSRLDLEVSTNEARFSLDVRLDAPGRVALPGGAGAWPADVVVDGPAPVGWAVIDAGGPVVELPAGSYRIRGRMPWDARPASLAVPPDVGVVALTVDGRAVARPSLEADGRLRLSEGDASGAADSRLELDVSRRIADGVPVVVTTRIDLRASGAAREIDLGAVALPGTVPVDLASDLPARFDADGRLVVLVRPGTATLTFEARHEGPVRELRAPTLPEPWPAVEYWAWQPNDPVRAATPSGPPGVDPSRTPLPEDWRRLAAFRVTPDTPLGIEELRRGEPAPAPNEVTLGRELWLDLDGGGWTVRDRFSGTLRQGWRLDAAAPLELGHAAVDGEDRVVTVGADVARGVELRAGTLALTAESRVEGGAGALPAVGWATDVRSLDATVHLPPGWSLVAAGGVDRVGGDASWVSRWNLWDLFFVLVVGLAVGRVVGWRWGAVALLALALGRHEVGAPAWIWAVLVVVVAIARGVPWAWARTTGWWTTWALLVLLAGTLVPWGVTHLREGIWPATARDGSSSDTGWSGDLDRFADLAVDDAAMAPPAEYEEYDVRSRSSIAGAKQQIVKKDLSLQYDPGATIQTGPGVPTWSWRASELRWSGPVPADHTIRLWLVPPWANALLAVLRVASMLALGFAFAGAARRLPRPSRAEGASSAAAAGLVLLLVGAFSPSTPASASPSTELLAELERRITAPPACRPSCVVVGDARVVVDGAALRIEATVHAGAEASWPIPGPAGTWAPSSATLDGQPAAVARLSDGHLHVRVPAGAHRVTVVGPLPAADALTLTWALRPQRVAFSGAGWSFEGRRADGSAEPFAQLTRTVREGAPEGQRADELAPWVEIERFVDLGVPWRVRTTVTRLGPTVQPLALRVPLLPGESVTESDYEGDGASRLVTLPRGEASVSWVGTLATAETVTLRAPEGVPWSEVWRVACSPVFSCATEGIAPVAHTSEGRWEPSWRPWPGESVVVAVRRPDGAEGATTTIDGATLTLTPGRRQTEAQLALVIRTTQGGAQVIGLPAGARLTSVDVGGRTQPIQLRDDGSLHVPLVPGRQDVRVAFVLDGPTGVWFAAPPIDLGGPAVDVRVDVQAPEERWIVALFGPSWGPVPLYVVYLVLVIVGATILTRLKQSPLAWWQWALLGLGMTQVPAFIPLVVAGWLFALAWRGRTTLENPWTLLAVQLGLLGYTVVALGCLYGAVHAGLLFVPDMQVVGNGSSNGLFRWYVDRVDGALPAPVVVSLPLWVWRVFMLLWALWLAASLVSWLRRGFVAMGHGGWFRPLPLDALIQGPRKARAPEEPAADAAPSEAAPEPEA
jgi:hypothetical protein